MTVAFAFFRTVHVIEAGRQKNILRIQDWKPRKYGVALNSGRVFARRQKLIVETFGEFLESLAEDHLQAEPVADFVSDSKVSGTGHAIVDFIEAKDVRLTDAGMR